MWVWDEAIPQLVSRHPIAVLCLYGLHSSPTQEQSSEHVSHLQMEVEDLRHQLSESCSARDQLRQTVDELQHSFTRMEGEGNRRSSEEVCSCCSSMSVHFLLSQLLMFVSLSHYFTLPFSTPSLLLSPPLPSSLSWFTVPPSAQVALLQRRVDELQAQNNTLELTWQKTVSCCAMLYQMCQTTQLQSHGSMVCVCVCLCVCVLMSTGRFCPSS